MPAAGDSVSARADALEIHACDKRRAFLTLLNDEERAKLSDREIARACKVDHKTVGKLCSDLAGDFPGDNQPRAYNTKHGTPDAQPCHWTFIKPSLICRRGLLQKP